MTHASVYKCAAEECKRTLPCQGQLLATQFLALLPKSDWGQRLLCTTTVEEEAHPLVQVSRSGVAASPKVLIATLAQPLRILFRRPVHGLRCGRGSCLGCSGICKGAFG